MIRCLFILLFICLPAQANDFGVNECGDACYSGGCPKCWKDDCREATKRFQEYQKTSKGKRSWAELFLVQDAFQKCQDPKEGQSK